MFHHIEVLMSVPPTRPDLKITSSDWPFSGHFGSLSVQSWFYGQNSKFVLSRLFCWTFFNNISSTVDITHFSILTKFFHILWITYAFSIAGPGVFSWMFSLPSGRYTDISINCNTVYTTSCRLTTRGFTRCWATTTERHFMFLVWEHALSTFSVICVVGGTVMSTYLV